MSAALRLSTLVLFLLAAPAMAQQADIEIGTTLICDTQKQVERFVALFDGNAERAITVVNAESNDPGACIVATVAYVTGQEIATARGRIGAFHIVPILVVGVVVDGNVRAAAAPAVFFSLSQVEERGA